MLYPIKRIMQLLQYMALVGGILAQFMAGGAQPQFEQVNAEIQVVEAVEEPEKTTFIVEITGYSSTVDQTDDTPFETASGKMVRDGIVACNFLPFGTQIKIPEFYGDKVFTVEDRMAKRFSNRVDIWFETRSEAIHFGLRNLEIELVDPDLMTELSLK